MKHVIHRRLCWTLMLVVLCAGTVMAQTQLYWSEHFSDAKIRRANTDGSGAETILTPANTGFVSAETIAFDPVGNKLYLTSLLGQKIQRANLDGSVLEDLVTGLSGHGNVTIDVMHRKMYWTVYSFSAQTGTIHRADLDGSNQEMVMETGNAAVTGLALDEASSKIYFVTSQPGTVNRVDYDGNNREELLQIASTGGGLSLDVSEQMMYWWANGGEPVIERAKFDGTARETIVSNSPNPVFQSPNDIVIDLAAEKLYWTDLAAESIQRADLDGQNVEEVLTSGVLTPQSLVLAPGTTHAQDDLPPTVMTLRLHQNYPNPFNPSTTISFDLSEPGPVTLIVHDMFGREVVRLLDGPRQAGHHEIQFKGETLASGQYLYRLHTAGKTMTRSMTLIK
ncbi:DUF5050 domain-containing protein [bacterium]|nr:DUF5050 domain-containing protein [bacterium]